MHLNTKRNKLALGVFILILIYVIVKTSKIGNDINVYLFASKQLFDGENIYQNNPYNNYLYSPFFALILRPFSIFEYEIGRVFWGITNLILTVRLWKITCVLVQKSLNLSSQTLIYWSLGVCFISVGLFNHNLTLGQITIVLLWIIFEGLYQILHKKKLILGSALLAAGIAIKIIPLIALFYLFFKGKFKALIFSGLFVVFCLFLPSIFIGHDYNQEMLLKWAETINPSNSKFVLENNNGTQSLNGLLPAYLYEFEKTDESPIGIDRQVASIPYNTLVILLHAVRIVILFSSLLLIFYRYKKREHPSLFLLWEISYLALVSALIFPHQQKYAMFFYLPSCAYILLFMLLAFRLKWKVDLKYKLIALLASILMFIASLMGRDIIGTFLVETFEYYHGFGLINLIFLGLMLAVKPDFLIELNEELGKKLLQRP